MAGLVLGADNPPVLHDDLGIQAPPGPGALLEREWGGEGGRQAGRGEGRGGGDISWLGSHWSGSIKTVLSLVGS